MKNVKLTCSPSPHVKSSITTRRIMIDVCIALLPALVMGIVYFGLKALLLTVISIASAVLSETVFCLIQKKKLTHIISQFDFTSCVTGLLIAMSIGVQTPLYAPVFANAFAIIVVKMLFGGTGKNLVNPAIAGRIFAFVSFTTVMASGWIEPSISAIFGGNSVNVETGATIVGNLFDKINGGLPTLSNLDLFLGTGVAGCIGETCKLAIILGGIYLAVRKVINLSYPLLFISVTGLLTVMLNGFNFAYFLPSILSGSLMLGAVFMATDYTTTPNTTLGNVLYFIMLGILTAILRYFTKMEVVSFAILLMNLFLPLIDKFILSVPFGKRSKAISKEK